MASFRARRHFVRACSKISPSASKVYWAGDEMAASPRSERTDRSLCNTFEKTVPSFCFKNVVPKFMNTKIMSNQVYYVLARVGADSIGLYVESPDFDSAYDVAEERIAQSYKGPFIVQAVQLINVGKPEHATR